MFLRASPIDVSGLLQDKLFEKVPTVVLTSATLSSAGNFRFIRERLGLDQARRYDRGIDLRFSRIRPCFICRSRCLTRVRRNGDAPPRKK